MDVLKPTSRVIFVTSLAACLIGYEHQVGADSGEVHYQKILARMTIALVAWIGAYLLITNVKAVQRKWVSAALVGAVGAVLFVVIGTAYDAYGDVFGLPTAQALGSDIAFQYFVRQTILGLPLLGPMLTLAFLFLFLSLTGILGLTRRVVSFITRRMTAQLLLRVIILAIAVPAVCGLVSAQSVEERRAGARIVYADCETPYELVLLSVKYKVGHLFLITEGRHFNEADLKTLFRCISAKYPEFSALAITLFSDRRNLDVAIRSHIVPPMHENPPADTSKSDCADLARAVAPCPYGYHRARFRRWPGQGQFFSYSPDPASTAMKDVVIDEDQRRKP